jgi:hypothetical protein
MPTTVLGMPMTDLTIHRSTDPDDFTQHEPHRARRGPHRI